MKKHAIRGKRVSRPRNLVKKRKKRTQDIVRQYQEVFSPLPLPYQGTYKDEESLEQPSALKYVPSTTTPAGGTIVDPRMRRDAELE